MDNSPAEFKKMTKITISLTNLDFEASRHFDFRLGQWCTESSSPAIPSPISSNEKLEKYAGYSNDLSNRVISSLGRYLNIYYGIHFSERFWKIALTPFVYQWISSNYFKYLQLEELRQRPEFQASTLAFYFLKNDDKKIHYSNGDRYLELIQADHLTHLEFQRLIAVFIKNVNITYLENPVQKKLAPARSLKLILAGQIDSLISFGGKFYLGNVYGFSRKDKIKLALKRPLSLIASLASGVFEKVFTTKWDEIPVSLPQTEKNLSAHQFQPQNEFEKYVADFIVENLPLDVLAKIPAQPWPRRVKAWIANLEYENQKSIYQVARVVENGGKWLSVQHGGCYGQLYPFTLSSVEYDLTDHFVSWGWKNHPPYRPKTMALPSPMLSKLPTYKFQGQEKILLVGTFAPLVPFRFDSYMNVANFFEYKKIQINFFKNISPTYQKYLVFRDYFSKQNLFPPMNDFLKAHNIPRSATRATEEAPDCKLVVIDHCGTTLLQTLAMNVPTIMYWEENICQLSSEALSDFKALMEVGIWHTNEVDAANFINSNYDNIPEWWNSPRTQNAVKTFCQKYALTSENYQESWEKFLEGIAP